MKLINLTQGQVTRVSNKDYEWLSQWKWYAFKVRIGYYAVRNVIEKDKSRMQFMHKVILGIDGTSVTGDHKSGDKLNNTRGNLRKATAVENSRNSKLKSSNTSGYKGVSFNKRDNKFVVHIRGHNNKVHLGVFTDKINAAKMYDFWARDLHGKFANINFTNTRLICQSDICEFGCAMDK